MAKTGATPTKITFLEHPDDVLSRYYTHLEAHSMSRHTTRALGGLLSHFLNYLGPLDMRNVNHGDLTHYLDSPGPPKYRRLWALRSLYGYLYSRQHIERDPTRGLKSRKQHNGGTKRYISQEQARLICEYTLEPEARALVELLYATGMRIGEAAALTVPDVDLGKGEVMVRNGKGGKQRITFLGEPAIKSLQTHLGSRREGPIFSVGLKSLANWVGQAGKRIGIKGLHPHELRAAMATHMIENGATLDTVRRLLGHEHISTTANYIIVTQQAINKAAQR